MQVAQFQAHIVFRAEDVRAEGGLGSEVHGVGAGGDIVVGEECPSAEFEIGGEMTVAFEIPLEAEWIEAHAVRGISRLEDEEEGNRVDRIFKPSAKKAGQVRTRQDPSVAQAGVEDAGASSPATDGMAAGRPDLDFVAAFLRAGLGEAKGRCN